MRSIASSHRKLAAQWHPTRNGSLAPCDVTFGSHKKVWWRCGNGHEWEASVNKRTSGRGCPRCYDAQRSEIVRLGRTRGKRKLHITHPEIAAEWHRTKNTLRSCDITHGSDVKAWWLCSKGHEWESTIGNRTLQHQGCPYCAGNRVHVTTSLSALRPEMAVQWHPIKNLLAPTDVTCGSNYETWWLCSKGHEYPSPVKARSRGRGCPFCSGNQVHETTSLLAMYPTVAVEWHPTLNGDVTPKDLTYGSKRMMWWLCQHGHRWQAKVNDRTHGYGCPICWQQRRGWYHSHRRQTFLDSLVPTSTGIVTPEGEARLQEYMEKMRADL